LHTEERQPYKYIITCIIGAKFNVCFSHEKPSRLEKFDLAQSIIDTFPVLKDTVSGGYVSGNAFGSKLLLIKVTFCIMLHFV
jgi:hypothetical protein